MVWVWYLVRRSIKYGLYSFVEPAVIEDEERCGTMGVMLFFIEGLSIEGCRGYRTCRASIHMGS